MTSQFQFLAKCMNGEISQVQVDAMGMGIQKFTGVKVRTYHLKIDERHLITFRSCKKNEDATRITIYFDQAEMDPKELHVNNDEKKILNWQILHSKSLSVTVSFTPNTQSAPEFVEVDIFSI